jgi:hypothetical protein
VFVRYIQNVSFALSVRNILTDPCFCFFLSHRVRRKDTHNLLIGGDHSVVGPIVLELVGDDVVEFTHTRGVLFPYLVKILVKF